MRIFQPIISGSAVITGNLEVAQGITGSLFGTASYAITASYVSPTFISASAAASGFGGATVSASYALTASYYGGNVISASYALTASYVNTLNQSVLITDSLTIGTSSLGANENTLVLGPSPAGGTGEGGQILLQASGGLYTSASMWDNYQNLTRLLRGTNAGSDAVVAAFNMHNKQVQFPAYTNASSFTGTATANLAVDSSGNIITVSTSGGSVFPYVGDAVITGSLTATTAIYAQANGAMYFRGGDDAELWDINVANTIGVYGQQDSTVGSIKLGSGGGTISGRSGSIGIGTTTPTLGTLQVNGNVYATSFTGSLFGSASYALTASYALNGGGGGTTNTGSLLVTASVSNNTITFTKGDASTFAITVNSGSLFGTASWSQNAVTASYVLNSISSSYSATASYVNTLNQNVIVNGAVTASYIIVSGSGSNVNRLLVIGSGSNIPLFTVQGSSGELFSITDSLSGSLFSVNDISGLPILEAFSDGIVTIGNPTAPSLYTTVKVTSVVGNNTIYSIPTSSYDGAWFEYTIKSGSNARAGQIMSIWNGTSVSFTETTTTDIGSTSGVAFTSILSGANLLITGSTSTANWTIKGIVRSI